MNGLKNRRIQDILPTAADGLAGFPDAIAAVFPVIINPGSRQYGN
jgi:transposase-like protein